MDGMNGFDIRVERLKAWPGGERWDARVYIGTRLVWLSPVFLSEVLALCVARDWCCAHQPDRVLDGFAKLEEVAA